MPIITVLVSGAIEFLPLVDPKHRRRGPQTRLDSPQTDLCRQLCRVISHPFAVDTLGKHLATPVVTTLRSSLNAL